MVEEINKSTTASVEKGNDEQLSKEAFAFEKLKKELRLLKAENAQLRANIGEYETQACRRAFEAQGGRKNAFNAFKKANDELLADGLDAVDGKKIKKEQDYFFDNQPLKSSNAGVNNEPERDELGGLKIV